MIAEIARQLRVVGEDQQAPAPEKLAPAVSVRRSIGRDHLVCLACGKKQRMLKRHLASEHDLTPNGYREMFSLKPDYPIVAPSYAEARRELALKIGLGRPTKPTRKEAPAPEAPAKTRRTRAKAAWSPPSELSGDGRRFVGLSTAILKRAVGTRSSKAWHRRCAATRCRVRRWAGLAAMVVAAAGPAS